MSNAGDEVWNWAYKPAGKNATPGGNMYNLLAYELPQRVRDSIMQYSYKGSAPGGNIYNTICFEIPGMLKTASPKPSRRSSSRSTNCPKKSASWKGPRNDRHDGKPTTDGKHNGSNRDAGLRADTGRHR